MYRVGKQQSLTNNSAHELSRFVEDKDVFNSLFLKYITDQDIVREIYVITDFEYRPDLIAKDYYGSDSYMGILMVQAAIPLEGYVAGVSLELIPKQVIDAIIQTI